MVIAGTGSVLAHYDYNAYGSLMRSTNPNQVNYEYTGQEQDDETGLQNYRARMYDGETGIFYAVDPARQFPSPYLYAGNSPVNGTDPDGKWFVIDDAIVAGVGFLGGYITHGVSTGSWGKDALTSGLVTAGSAWLGYNTAGATSVLAKGIGANSGMASVIGQGIGGVAGAVSGNIGGQLVNNGSVNWQTLGQSALYGLGSGLASGLMRLSPLNDQLFPFHHMAKHIINSSVSQMAGNMFTGRNPFNSNSFGLDPSILFPALLDVSAVSSPLWAKPLANKIVQSQKNTILENSGIKGGNYADIEVNSFGRLDFYVDRKGGISTYLKNASVRFSGLAKINLPFLKTIYII